MNPKPIALIRAAYLNLLMDIAKNRGSENPAAALQLFNLPANQVDNPSAYLPLNAVMSFAQHRAGCHGLDNLIIDFGSHMSVLGFGVELQKVLFNTASLENALDHFVRLAGLEQSNMQIRLLKEDGTVRMVVEKQKSGSSQSAYLEEWLMIISLMTIVRHFTGHDWYPAEISLQTRRQPGQRILDLLQHTQLLTGQSQTGIAFPSSLLRLSVIQHRTDKVDAFTRESHAPTATSWDFPTSLQAIVRSYLYDGYPDIHLAAKITGYSVRTIQRRLKEFALSYTVIVQKARFEVATELLRNPDTRIIDAAFAVGYEEPSHFSRAFRRILGITPYEYRQLNCVHKLDEREQRIRRINH